MGAQNPNRVTATECLWEEAMCATTRKKSVVGATRMAAIKWVGEKKKDSKTHPTVIERRVPQ